MPDTTTAPLKPVFTDCGRVVATAAVAAEINPAIVSLALVRHFNGDWGCVEDDSRQMNAEALLNRDGSRLMSVYRDLGCQELWVITDGYGNDPADPDQCYTTVLFPSDY